MQSLKYLVRVVDEETRFGVILDAIVLKKTDNIQRNIALSLLEYLNKGKYINHNDLEKEGNFFYVSKEKYFKPEVPPNSKVFAIRVSLSDSEEETNKKLAELREKVKDYKI